MPSVPEAADNPPSFSLVPEGNRLRISLSGDWTKDCLLPDFPALAPGTEVEWSVSDLGKVDSALPAWIQGLGRAAPSGVAFRHEGLPPRIRAWVLLTADETEPDGEEEHLPWLAKLGLWATLSKASWIRAVSHIGELALGLARLLGGRAKVNWQEFPQLLRTAGPDALPITLLLGFLTGVIMAYVGMIQLGKVGANIYVANLVGLAMAREMGALMTGVVACGRTSTAYASHLGSMNVSQETDALRAIGLRPVEYLGVPRLLAVLAVLPLLSVFATAAGILGGMAVAVGYGMSAEQYTNQVIEAVSVRSFLTGLIKAHAFALIVAWAGCYRGHVARRNARGVGEAATTAAVLGITLLVVADAVFAVLFNLFAFY
ncbi:MAG: ABC transporter permease [Opitutia bacterium]|jgi:phospholipid/cholesterol/gamma-HCH transport system permease protein